MERTGAVRGTRVVGFQPQNFFKIFFAPKFIRIVGKKKRLRKGNTRAMTGNHRDYSPNKRAIAGEVRVNFGFYCFPLHFFDTLGNPPPTGGTPKAQMRKAKMDDYVVKHTNNDV